MVAVRVAVPPYVPEAGDTDIAVDALLTVWVRTGEVLVA